MSHCPSLDATPRQAGALERHFINDQFVVFEMASDRLHYLNGVAALVFELCDGDHSVSAIVELVRVAYNLAASPSDEVLACIDSLRLAGIIMLSLVLA